jgi:hypothetical protein
VQRVSAASDSEIIEEETVTVSVTGKSKTDSKALAEIKVKARQDAVRKYLLRADSGIPETIVEKAVKDYSKYVGSIKDVADSSTWVELDKNLWQLTRSYSVELKTDLLRQFLAKEGYSSQGNFELIVWEEVPTLASMKLQKAFGNDLDGANFFVQNYTTFQRRLRDAVIRKANVAGLRVRLLEDNPLYKKYKSKDGTLVGTYFDAEKNDFVIDRDLWDSVIANNPDSFALSYRIESMDFENDTHMIYVTVAYYIQCLRDEDRRPLGAGTEAQLSKRTTITGIMDEMTENAEQALIKVLNDDAVKVLKNFIEEKQKKEQRKRPLTLSVNGKAFDAKIRKKALYTLKKELVAKGIASESSIKSANDNLTAVIDNEEIKSKSPEDLYFEHVSPILEEIGIELTDDFVNYYDNTLTITTE